MAEKSRTARNSSGASISTTGNPQPQSASNSIFSPTSKGINKHLESKLMDLLMKLDTKVELMDTKLDTLTCSLNGLELKLHEVETKINDICKRTDAIIVNVDKLNYEVSDLKDQVANATFIASAAEDQSKQACTEVEKMEEKLQNLDNLQKSYVELQDKYKYLHEKHLTLEGYSRRNNLIVVGIDQSENENCQEKISKMMTTNLKIDAARVNEIKLSRCHRLPGKKPAPIICRFERSGDRDIVWAARKNLAKSKIFLNEHFPDEVLKRRNVLRPIMLAAVKLKRKATLKYDKLIIDGVSYTVDSLHNLPSELDPAHIATRKVDNITCFFTEASPLSNFYPSPIELENQTYRCVEEYFQFQKANFAEKPNVMSAIKQANHPRDFKRLGDTIKDIGSDWLPFAQNQMYKACLYKFQHDDRCRKFLLETNDTDIGEASTDITWGIGKRLNDPSAFKKETWSGKNLLGKILMRIRNELKDQL